MLRIWIRLPSSGVTCQVALILYVFHSLFSKDILALFPFIWGLSIISPNSDIPPQSCLRASRLEVSGGKSKKQGAVVWRSYRVILEYFLGSETFLPKTGGPILSYNHKLRALCLLNYSKRLKNVASNLHYTMQMIKCQTKWSHKRPPKPNPISQEAKWGPKK